VLNKTNTSTSNNKRDLRHLGSLHPLGSFPSPFIFVFWNCDGDKAIGYITNLNYSHDRSKNTITSHLALRLWRYRPKTDPALPFHAPALDDVDLPLLSSSLPCSQWCARAIGPMRAETMSGAIYNAGSSSFPSLHEWSMWSLIFMVCCMFVSPEENSSGVGGVKKGEGSC
jgi:hypothetical protein